ncbi:Sec-independent protein translocase subunit TatA [Lapillicoccus jejuensis]|uniref:Sec-independent protein translocase protein TatA n=1 Tax=Lapillicoccus jejuensis TaxID=402171 RepID=A0A542E4Q1_9MICO|nr:Sec-independent protein translocase subunit TatA [Lapillicoccus jejuensis]TQJ10323.1 sec-independent protein translocase protein TatA [Lapillicoccus jejuensis]
MWRDLFQPSHLIIILVLVVVLFGWKKLPDAARSVGRSMRIFKSEMGEMKNEGKESRPSPAASDTIPGQAAPTATTAPTAPTAPTAQTPPPAQPYVAPHDASVPPSATTPPEAQAPPQPADAPTPHDTTAR